MDGQTINEHLITVAMELGETVIIERAPINPIVYLQPPTTWLSGTLGMISWTTRLGVYKNVSTSDLWFLG